MKASTIDIRVNAKMKPSGFKIRMNIAALLIKLAAFIARTKIEVELETDTR